MDNSFCDSISKDIIEILSKCEGYFSINSIAPFLSDESKWLANNLKSIDIFKLALVRQILEDIFTAFDPSTTKKSLELISPFLNTANNAYNLHLNGWPENSEQCNGMVFFRQFCNSSNLFSLSCITTKDIAINVMTKLDIFINDGSRTKMYISLRERILTTFMLIDNRISETEYQTIITHDNICRDYLDYIRNGIADVHGKRFASIYYSHTPLLSKLENRGIEIEVFKIQSNVNATGASPEGYCDENTETASIANLIGLKNIKAEIKRFESFLEINRRRLEAGLPSSKQTLHYVFAGNPGTGKTTVARILGKLLRQYGVLSSGHVIETDRSGLVAEYVGQTAVKTDGRITEAKNGILFIDEAYTLLNDESKNDYGKESIEVLLKRMEDFRNALVVIVAGYPEPMSKFIASNPGLQSRFTRFMHFEDYTPAEMGEIFIKYSEDAGYVPTQESFAYLSVLFHAAFNNKSDKFGNARFVRNVFEEMCSRQALRITSTIDNPDKRALQTLDTTDIPFNFVGLNSSQINIEKARWNSNCPKCGKIGKLKANVIGQKIMCKSCNVSFVVYWPVLCDI